MNQDLRRALIPVRRRLRLSRALGGLSAGALAGGLCCAAVMALSFFVPMPKKLPLMGVLLGGLSLLPALFSLCLPLPDPRAARAADACGLKERVQTALALSDRSDAMALLQRQDACQALKSLDVKQVPLRLPGRALLLCAVLLALTGGAFFLPNPQTAAVARMEAFAKKAEEAAQAAQEEAKALSDSLTEKERQELRKLLGDLSREMREAQSERDAYLALDEAEKRLESLRDGLEQQNAALEQAGMSALSEALESGDTEALSQAAENLMEHAAENAKALESAAEALSGMSAQALSAAADALSAGDLDALQAALSALSQGELAQSLKDLEALLAQLRAAGQGMSAKAGEGQGNNPGQGAGQGESEGEGAGGAGKGSTGQDQGYQEETGRQRGQGTGDPEYKETAYEAIYDPERLDASDTAIAESGTRSEGESLQLQTGPGLGAANGSVPYREVAAEYQQAAAAAADSAALPARERALVDAYFAAITE